MQKTQFKAPRIDAVRDASIGFRTTKKIKALSEIVAYDNNETVGMYIERLLLADFATAKVEQEEEDREPNDPKVHTPIKLTGGRLLSEVIDDLYDEDDATCFFKRVMRPRYRTHEQIRLNNLIQTSPMLYTRKGYNEVAIRQHWDILNEVAAGKATVDSLPEGMFDGADVAYNHVRSRAYQAVSQHPEEFTRRKRQLTLQTADSKPVLKGEKPVAFEKNALIDLLTNGAHPQAKVFKSITIASRASGANGQTKTRTTPPDKEPKPPQFGLR